MQSTPWQIHVDTGGTFTDCLACSPDGELRQVKVLSSSALRGSVVARIDPVRLRIAVKWRVPDDFIQGFRFRLLQSGQDNVGVTGYAADEQIIELNTELTTAVPAGAPFEVCTPEEAPILATRMVTGTLPGERLPEIQMRLATTRGTNALLERKGARVVLFITRGFGDLLLIGNQQRPDIFALQIVKPEPLYERVVEVDERLSAEGAVLQPLDPSALDKTVQALRDQGIQIAAVALMHSYLNPEHEQQLEAYLQDKGFAHVSASSELAPLIKFVPRAETAVVDAYLAPVLHDYLRRVQTPITSGHLHVMTSAGGLMPVESFRAKDSLFSGPAGGVVGAALAGKRSGCDKVIALDMGGTSTDVARFDGDYEYVFEQRIGEVHLVAPALAIETVAAGGGSICGFDGFRLRVGPESAGARPGPACYGAGGPLALTDVNLLLGRLDPDRFEIPISPAKAREKLDTLMQTITQATGDRPDEAGLLQGFLDIANERMANAIRRVSVRKGVDPRDYALVAFGGAGGQHACAIAGRLGIGTIIIPKNASLLSAQGLGHAVLERFAEKQVLQPLPAVEACLPEKIRELSSRARAAVAREGVAGETIVVRRRIVNLRFAAQDAVLEIEYNETASLAPLFQQKYREMFGHLPEGREIECESLRVVCSAVVAESGVQRSVTTSFVAKPAGKRSAYFAGAWQRVPCFERGGLRPGARFTGPVLVFETHSTTVVEQNWHACLDAAGAIVIKQTGTPRARRKDK